MGQFEYVMVLISIIVGLGITNVLLGLAAIVDRLHGPKPIRPRIAYFAWVMNTFVWLVQFWWWEIRFDTARTQWTVGLYWFLVLYAVTLFLLAAVLMPQTWEGVEDLGDYLLERRHWFYSIMLFGNVLDIVDSYLKGGFVYIAELPMSASVIWVAITIACIVGLRARTLRAHTVAAVIILALQVISAFAIPILGGTF